MTEIDTPSESLTGDAWKAEVTRLVYGMGTTAQTAHVIAESPWVKSREEAGDTPKDVVDRIREAYQRYSEDELVLATVRHLEKMGAKT